MNLYEIERQCRFYRSVHMIKHEKWLLKTTLAKPEFSKWAWGIARLKELEPGFTLLPLSVKVLEALPAPISTPIVPQVPTVTPAVNFNSAFISQNKVAVITALYERYETSCSNFIAQVQPCDFICFTDNSTIEANGWMIDSEAYHITNPSSIDTGDYVNSLCNNQQAVNIEKYYKANFFNIPRLSQYDVIIYIDADIEIIDPNFTQYYNDILNKHLVIGWEKKDRFGKLINEVLASAQQEKPMEDIYKQYVIYLANGYEDNFGKLILYPLGLEYGLLSV